MGGRKFREEVPEMSASREGRLQQGVCYRVRDKTGELDLEDRRERPRSAVRLAASLAGVFSPAL